MSTPGRNAYDDAMLLAIISGTDTALGKMQSVNSNVAMIAGQLPNVNRSTSGLRLGQALGDWTTAFNKVVGDMQMLNEKARSLMQLNRNIETETSTATSS
ncbi:hypothetical protein ACTG9Q_27580 [Actinokineospora sp. 24-640]